MKTGTKQEILDFLAKNERISAKRIIEHLGLSPVAVHKQLLRLLKEERIQKAGKPPKVFYSLRSDQKTAPICRLDAVSEQVINEHFIKISPDGILQSGRLAFERWCRARVLDPVRTAQDYAETIKKYDQYKHEGLIDGTMKLEKTFSEPFVDQLFYLDFYSIERFGKTKLGELVLYAKQSQNQRLIKMITDQARDQILKLITSNKIDAVGFVPPTVKRDVQFMKELEKMLQLPKPVLTITKIKTPIIVPQKTLSKLEERMENARQSIIVEQEQAYGNILLIDDAVGSGATMNEVARQIKKRKLCTGKLTGLGLTGSFSGFEIISEV